MSRTGTHEAWRYRCPAGHVSWYNYSQNDDERQYYCETCDEYFESLIDMKRDSAEEKHGD